jgi:hypothetical protein
MSGKPAPQPLLERLGISAGVMREREWRQLYIRGKTPEDAARQAETAYLQYAKAISHGRHTALATRTLGLVASDGPDQRGGAGALRGHHRSLERRANARLVTGHRHRAEGRLPLA